MATAPRPRIGLALGAGSARGWAHIGVLRALAELGVEPDVVAGTSVGAIVGAMHGLDALDGFEAWVRGLTRREILGYMDVGFSGGGFFEGQRLLRRFRSEFGDVAMADCRLPFGAVATDISTGLEVWLRQGVVADAVRASISLPGIFAPVRHEGRWLVDGGLVNPVPVSLARAMGADRVIAVSLNGDLLGRHFRRGGVELLGGRGGDRSDPNWMDRLASGLRERAPWLRFPGLATDQDEQSNAANEDATPGLLQVTASALNIMQDRITRSRMAGDPPDLLISPRLAHIGLLEFDRADEAISEGEASVQRLAPAVSDVVE